MAMKVNNGSVMSRTCDLQGPGYFALCDQQQRRRLDEIYSRRTSLRGGYPHDDCTQEG